MPTMSGSTSVAANDVSGNVLSGEQYEFAPFIAGVSIACVTTATGLRASFNVGGLSVLNEALVSRANRFPILPDDVLAIIGADPGDRLFLEFRNSTGGALVVEWRVDLNGL